MKNTLPSPVSRPLEYTISSKLGQSLDRELCAVDLARRLRDVTSTCLMSRR